MRYYLDLFAGIGGFALGAYWAGLKFDGHYLDESVSAFDGGGE
jgi:site-specific DNA-cytosine methylase